MAGIESIWRAVERLESEVWELRDLLDGHREVCKLVGGDDYTEPAWLRSVERRVEAVTRASERVRRRTMPLTKHGSEVQAMLAALPRRAR